MNRTIALARIGLWPVACSLWLCAGLWEGCAYKNKEADLVVHNARIITMDSVEHVYAAMAIKDGRIVELGAEQAIRNRYRAEATYDAAGQFVYPGFIDGHCHFLHHGIGLSECDLTGTASWEEVLQRVKDYAAKKGSGWVIGRGWDQNDWTVKEFPDRRELDKLFPDRPVLLTRIDGHAAIANAVALHAAGIASDTRIKGGEIGWEFINDGDRSWTDSSQVAEVLHMGYPFWEPTGLLIDNAVDLVKNSVPRPDDSELKEALLHVQQRCFAEGLTMVCDAGLDVYEIDAIQRLQQEGALKIRVYAMVMDKPENLAHFAASGPIITDRLIVRCAKIYADGALGSRGTLLKQPYADVKPDRYGLLLNTVAHFDSLATWCRQHGFQMATHCIGDSANKLILDVYGAALGGTNDLRWRIEHVQHMDPADWPLFAQWNVIPSMQPTHLQSDGPWVAVRIGDRFAHGYAWKTAMKQNGLIALGTDFPVEPISPVATYYAAVGHTYRDGSEIAGSPKEEALTRMDALRGMTIWNAIATFTEKDLGTLEVGKFADFTVLDRDILVAPLEQVAKAKVVATFVGGENMLR